jgi:hypothetical protein
VFRPPFKPGQYTSIRYSDRGTVSRTVFPARHAGLRSGGMGTDSDDIGRYESTEA